MNEIWNSMKTSSQAIDYGQVGSRWEIKAVWKFCGGFSESSFPD